MKYLDVISVWFLNGIAVTLTWMNLINAMLGTLAILLGMAYTIWRWRRSYLKNKNDAT